MEKIKFLFSALLLMFVLQVTNAQTSGVVSGFIRDAGTGEPVPFASVVVKGTMIGVVAGDDGSYKITVPDLGKNILVFGSVGYKDFEVRVSGKTSIDAALTADLVLDDVVVVAYGTATKKSITGSTVSISGDKLQKKSTDITKSLEGEVSGIQVIKTTGQPGVQSKIVIRGIGSVNSSVTPLYVVDGVPYGGAMTGIDPADIANVSVLKDASATALYGSRAANGVVLITTRKGGSNNGKISVDAEAKYGINVRTLPLHDVIDSPEEYIELSYKALDNQYNFLKEKLPRGFSNIQEMLFSNKGIIPQYNIWTVPDGKKLIDETTGKINPDARRIYTPEKWADHVFRIGKRAESNLRFAGGSEKMSFFTSLGYLKDEGYYISSDFNRFNIRNNLTYNVTKNFKNTVNLAYTRSSMNRPGQTDNQNNGFAYANMAPPIYPVFEHRLKEEVIDGVTYPAGSRITDPKIAGGYSYDYGKFNKFSRGYGAGVNPAGAVRLDKDLIVTDFVSLNYSADYSFLNYFKFQVNAGYQASLEERNTASNPFYGDAQGLGRLYRYNEKETNFTFNQILSFARTLGKHEIDAFVAHESFSYKYKYQYVNKDKVIIHGILELDNYVEPKDISSYNLGYNLESYFGQFKYSYADKYFFNASVRADGSSRFAPGKRWGVFGSAGAAWLISSENFMKNQKFFNELKLKASYGRIGNQEIVLGYDELIPNYFLFRDFYSMSNLAGNPAFKFYSKGNSELTWEISNAFNVGVESRILNFLTLNVDWFMKRTSNMLFRKQVAPSLGYAYYPDNDGVLVNSGIEVETKWDIYNKNDWNISAGLNFAHYRNRMAEMPVDMGTGKPKTHETTGIYGWQAGHSIYDHYTYIWKGVDKETGKPQYKAYRTPKLDAQGQPVLDENKNPVYEYITDLEIFKYKGGDLSKYEETVVNNIEDAVTEYTGTTALPDLTGGFNFDISWKGLYLSTSFAFGIGGYAIDGIYANLMHSGNIGSGAYHKDIRGAWSPSNKNSDIPMLTSGLIPYTYANATSTRFLTSRSYLTISNVRIGYNFPKKIANKLGLSRLGIYMSGDNLYTFTKRRGFFSATSLSGGSDFNTSQVRTSQRYLPVATFTAGVQVGF